MTLPLFDTHCHFDFPEFDQRRPDVLACCATAGVKAIMLPGVTEASIARLPAICQSLSGEGASHEPGVRLYLSLGLHPYFVEQHQHSHLAAIERSLDDGVRAIGEIGLDFWPGSTAFERQIELFEAQLDLALNAHLPVIIHSRKANDQVLKRLRQRPGLTGVIHAFSGSQQQAEQFIGQGFRLGIGGAVTYERAQRLRAIVAEVPLSALVLETDAPDMPMSGRQGAINRPDYLPQVFAQVAALREESDEQLAGALWQNSRQLFSLPADDPA